MKKKRAQIVKEIKASWPERLRLRVALNESGTVLEGSFTAVELRIIYQSMIVLSERITTEIGH